jgi:malate dehydrogenase
MPASPRRSIDWAPGMKNPIKIAITGAAGQVAYALLPRIASGSVFGPDQPVELRLIETPEGMKALEAVVMELYDSAFPLLRSVSMTDDIAVGFEAVSWAVLAGGSPRQVRMERRDLLRTNCKAFVSQGKAIMDHAAPDIRTLVVANPCNTNCLIAMGNATDVPAERWFAMSRLDENRAKAQLALKAGKHWADVTNVAIWGNHSCTLFPDFLNARIGGRPATEVIADRRWLEDEFVRTVQQRGKEVMKARGRSAACSAAHAVAETIRSIIAPTPVGDWTSIALLSDGSYGAPKGIVSSFPVRSDGSRVEIVRGVPVGDFARARISVTMKELVDERAMVQELIPSQWRGRRGTRSVPLSLTA